MPELSASMQAFRKKEASSSQSLPKELETRLRRVMTEEMLPLRLDLVQRPQKMRFLMVTPKKRIVFFPEIHLIETTSGKDFNIFGDGNPAILAPRAGAKAATSAADAVPRTSPSRSQPGGFSSGGSKDLGLNSEICFKWVITESSFFGNSEKFGKLRKPMAECLASYWQKKHPTYGSWEFFLWAAAVAQDVSMTETESRLEGKRCGWVLWSSPKK